MQTSKYFKKNPNSESSKVVVGSCFGKIECMLDFTMVKINVHDFNPCLWILHNHDIAYED